MPRFKSLPYRPCVGMAVFNRKGRVFIGRRINGPEHVDDTHAWQLPQGGIESGETPEQAVWRELWEETGLTKRDVRLVEQPPHWTIYEWPADMRTSDRIGQAHRWFFFEPLDNDVTPQPDGSEKVRHRIGCYGPTSDCRRLWSSGRVRPGCEIHIIGSIA